MIDHVDDTLKRWRMVPFVYGETDCMLSIGEYLMTRGMPDLTGQFRGTYADEAGALGHVAAHGGIAGLMVLTGLETTATPVRGDVVCLDTGEVELGALCTGSGVAARLERGVVEVDLRFAKITQSWKVP